MPELPEFTGERVIRGLVDVDLFNEHLARYRFAARFPTGPNVLDAGCGSGYGTAEFGPEARVIAMDVAGEALALARESFRRPGVGFVQGSCERLPFADATFHLVVGFEVIEHLERWREMLTEAARVLRPDGVLLVSTPNRLYYEESRAQAGPNPFHCHEFEYAEFEAALYEVFPHVRLWTQNHAEAIVFAPLNPSRAELEAPGDTAPDQANFFVAACSRVPVLNDSVYAWLPSSGNVLREREHHVAKLQGELGKKDAWLARLEADHATLQTEHELTLAELRRSNHWADNLDREMVARGERIAQLQAENADRLTWVDSLKAQLVTARAELDRQDLALAALDREVAVRTEWALSLESDLAARTEHVRLQAEQIAEQIAIRQAERIAQRDEYLALTTRLRETQEAEIAHRDGVIEGLERDVLELRRERALIAGSKWLHLGRRLRLGPVVDPT